MGFQPGEGPTRGLLCDCKILSINRLQLYLILQPKYNDTPHDTFCIISLSVQIKKEMARLAKAGPNLSILWRTWHFLNVIHIPATCFGKSLYTLG